MIRPRLPALPPQAGPGSSSSDDADTSRCSPIRTPDQAAPAGQAPRPPLRTMIEPGIFKANDIRGIATGEQREWDADGAYVLGAALVDALDLTRAEGTLVLGRDMRTTSPELSWAFTEGALSRG